jgi:hypothetical protein
MVLLLEGGSNRKITIVGCLGVEPSKVGIAQAEGLCDWRTHSLVEDLCNLGKIAIPAFIYTLAPNLQLTKTRKSSVRVAEQWMLINVST